jgi:hypothetical protein
MKKSKSGFLALTGLVAVASLFTVCKATGVGGNLFTTLFDRTIEVGYGELRALQPHEKELLTFSKTELAKFESKGKTIALSNGDKILGFSSRQDYGKLGRPRQPVGQRHGADQVDDAITMSNEQ